jgi:hypothetical protein
VTAQPATKDVPCLGIVGGSSAAPVLVDYSAEALEEPFRGTLESSTESMVMDHEVYTYADLLRQIHNDLRNQHPEWIQPNGESPMCDSYEVRLMELLDTSIEGDRISQQSA